MKVLELFAGSRSVGKICDRYGWEVFSVDTEPFDKINLQKSVIDLERNDIPFIPDIIWGSPVCSAWSKTGWFHYWNTDIYRSGKTFVAKKEYANTSVEMVRKTIEVFSWFPDAYFFMENPEGLLYRHPVINNFSKYGLLKNYKRDLVTYCQYGDTVRKPTQIWNNCKAWIPKPTCSNGDTCHISSPRCTQKGVRSKKDAFERSKVPEQLIIEILNACIPQ